MTNTVEWLVPGPNSIPFAGRFQGREALTGFFQKLAETTELSPIKIDQYVEQGTL